MTDLVSVASNAVQSYQRALGTVSNNIANVSTDGYSRQDVTLAANQVLLQFVYLASYAMDGFVFAAESLVGQAMGAKAVAQLRRGASVTAVWAFGSAIVMAAGFWIAGPFVIDVMAKDPAVQQAARLYLPHMALAPLLGALAWMLDGVFIGATRTKDMRNMMILSFLGYCGLVLLLLPSFGNHGLWMAMNGFFILRGVSLALRYPALERGTIDGAEWVGPYDDEKLGFNKVARFYHYPGWWEGASCGTLFINERAWNTLPKHYQAMMEAAAGIVTASMVPKYDALNPQALKRLIAGGTQLKPFSRPVLQACYDECWKYYDEVAAQNANFKRILDSMKAFRPDEIAWFRVAEGTFDNFLHAMSAAGRV